MPLKHSFPPNIIKQIEFRRFVEMLRKFFKLFKNGLSPRDKTISETKSETAVVAVSSFSQKFAKVGQYF